MTHRFYLNEDNRIMDALNPANNEKADWWEDYGYPRNEQCFRELLLWRHLGELLPNLMINTNRIKVFYGGVEYQPPCEETVPMWSALHATIKASHLNTLDVALSVQHKFDGKLKREKPGWEDVTSLSLFVDDVERLLRDLYGESDIEAIDRVREAVLVIVTTFTEHLRRDLWKEHDDALDFDYILGIGVPEGCGISGSEWRRGMWAKVALFTRACEVSTNPSAYSEYTVEFAKRFGEHWALPNNHKEFLSLTEEEKMRWLAPAMNSSLTEEGIPF